MAWYNDIDTTKKYRLGWTKSDVAGNEYIYLKGVASVVAEDFVSYDENFAMSRTLADRVGPCGVAMSALDAATKFGWAQIFGNGTVDSATVAADKALYLTATAGRVDDTDVAGDLIHGMVSTGADATNSLPVRLNYPIVYDTAAD